MAILSYADYNDCWTLPAPRGFGQIGCPPCYHEYLQREIYKQDYLDLFINVKTFERKDDIIAGRFYVKITGNSNLEGLAVPEHDLYTTNENGTSYLLVDYDYPWTIDELKKKRSIKYVMIGEAAPANMAYFFYYILELQEEKTLIKNEKGKIVKDYKGYVTAPYIAFFGGEVESCNDKRKKQILLDFADKGVILLDIFPFAINYDPIRNDLKHKGIDKSYFNKLMDLFKTKYNFNDDVKGVFVAPPTISHNLAKEFNGGRLVTPISLRLGINSFNPAHTAKTKNDFFFNEVLSTSTLNGIVANLPVNKKKPHITIQVPLYVCCAYSGAMTVPHYLFIKNALGL